ncbi:efflux RND transporter periplasmic adaptor subunit [Fibrobacterales bacterium]|nr:efflux RND transporter periplasmic adaptor subunit [Fibrobacterales bacterium]
MIKINKLALASLLASSFLVGCDSKNEPHFIQGQVEARQVNVAAKIPGRLNTILVLEGSHVQKGDLIADMISLELEAKRMQTLGLVEAAQAQQNKAQSGARSDEILGAKSLWERAKEAENLALKTFNRVSNLFKGGVVSAQKKDEAEANYKASAAAVRAARSQYSLARKGARSEDKAAARGLLMQAEAGKAEVEAYLDETKIMAPISGEVGIRLAEAGEVISAGLPIVTIVDLEDIWVEFQVREDQMAEFKKGQILQGLIPGVGGQKFEFKITYFSAVADYATWRSVRETGGFDLKTFRVRATPVAPIVGIRPGMSVQFSL